MTFRRPSALTTLAIVLLFALPALALLQYRWVGQVSDAERERMLHNLETAASQFREGLDGDVARAFLTLRLDVPTVRDASWERYADRYATWSETAPHPAVVSSVWLVDADAGRLRIRRWDQADRQFGPAEWPAALQASRDHFARELDGFAAGRTTEARPPFLDEDSVLVSPLIDPQFRRPPTAGPEALFGFTVVELNLAYIRDQLLPELTQRHFAHADGETYRVAVTTSGPQARVIFQSDPSAPVAADRADATIPLLGRFGDPAGFLRGTPGGRQGGSVSRRRGPPSFDGRGPGDANRPRTRGAEREGARWLLLVQHPSGSLEAAVGVARRRNLGVSFGVLALLTVSVVMLARSSQRAQRLARQQMEFVAGVSHELRTPVAVIRLAAENLAGGVVSHPDRVKNYGTEIGNHARRLGEMIERVLQYAALEAGDAPLARGAVRADALVEAAIEASAPLVAAGAVVERHFDPALPPVLGDPVALRSVVENLIANAVKYGGPDRWVGIHTESVRDQRRPSVRISVTDHGPGIKPSDLPHIFEPFFRGADALTRRVSGNGLGLSIVKRIVEAHGGRIAVGAGPGTGTTFTVTLPAAPEGTAETLGAAASSPLGAAGGAAAGS